MAKERESRKTEQIQKAYLYLVKIPSSNDLIVCAAESVFYPGTYVVAPTRYGQDMGIVVGSAAGLGQEETYRPGCKACLGACHFGPTPRTEEDDQRLVAMGSIEDGDVIIEVDGHVTDMGPLPEFEIRSDSEKNIVPDEAEADESGVWDQAYKEPELVEVDGDALWISHMATPDEIRRYSENKEEEKEAIKICREKIAKHNLDMKLVTAHFLLSEPKVLFFFTESRVLGGLAVCGRDFCCHCVSDKLKPVTIKMAKEQNLSLNSMKISGPCGRLLCCLSYEYDFYLEEKQAYPAEGSRIKLGQDLFKVTEINILSHKMTVSGSEGRQFTIPRSELYFNHEKGRWEVSQQYQEEFLSN